MNRDAIRDLAASELGLKTSRYLYAESREELHAAVAQLGLPLVVKPVMSSSGKGQSTMRTAADIDVSWDYAAAGMRGDRLRVIAEQFIDFDYEITLLTIRAQDGVHFCPPIGHRQEHGDYRESWQPAAMSAAALKSAQDMAARVVDALGGYGLFGVEFFVKGDEVIFRTERTILNRSVHFFETEVMTFSIRRVRVSGVLASFTDSTCSFWWL